MPSVPRYTQTERPRGYASITPVMDGANAIARAMQGLAQGAENVGKAADKIANAELDNFNKAVAQEKMADYERERLKKWDEQLKREGKNALGDKDNASVVDECNAWHQDKVKELMEGSNEAQKELMREYFIRRGFELGERAMSFQNNQQKVYEKNAANAFQASMMKEAVNDTTQTDRAMANMETSIWSYNKGHGVSPDVTRLQIQKNWDSVAGSSVDAYLDRRDVDGATRYVDTYKDRISGAQADALRERIRERGMRIKERDAEIRIGYVASEIFRKAADQADALDMAGKEYGDDPAKRNALILKVRNLYKEAAEAEEHEWAVRTEKSVKAINADAGRLSPGDFDAFRADLPDKRLKGYADLVRNESARPWKAPVVSDPEAKNAAIHEIKHKGNPYDAMLKYAARLSPADRTMLLTTPHEQLVKVEGQKAMTMKHVLDGVWKALDIGKPSKPSDSQRETMDRFLIAFENELGMFASKNGRQASGEEMVAIGNRLLVEITTRERKWWGGRKSRRVFEGAVQEPKDIRDRVAFPVGTEWDPIRKAWVRPDGAEISLEQVLEMLGSKATAGGR